LEVERGKSLRGLDTVDEKGVPFPKYRIASPIFGTSLVENTMKPTVADQIGTPSWPFPTGLT
jgi:hypothetical protein